jgi:aryl-alcohol dehydrogenase-like predicted oxidoreductase
MAIRDRCGLLAYSPLAMGTLTGKYLNGARPAGARLTRYERFKRYSTPRAERAIAQYVALARQRGIDPGQMALAFAAAQPFVTSLIIGATSVTQLEQDVACLDITVDADLRAAINAIHAEGPNPCP